MNFYDGVETYFKSLKSHFDQNEGKSLKMTSERLKSMICNRTIEGTTTNLTMNSICDRIDLGYAVFDLDPDSGCLQVLTNSQRKKCKSKENSFVQLKKILVYPSEPFDIDRDQLQWLNSSRSIYFLDKNSTSIPSTPRCGFNHLKCPKKSFVFVSFSSSSISFSLF